MRLFGLAVVVTVAMSSFIAGAYVAAHNATDVFGWLAVAGNVLGGLVVAVVCIAEIGMALLGPEGSCHRSWTRTLAAWVGFAIMAIAAAVMFLRDVIVEPNKAQNWFFLGCAVVAMLTYACELDKWARTPRELGRESV
ncbi:hypothetical protein [Mycobacteroides sp. LB1]|uniref:hypothetical protein n=1 Tax=Mycobacteroides sp. LB1 TaxID=2750814 RepID=UPI0015DDCB90|nr:hypothetical protein [Mycobacteroides sp. LB1]